MNTSDSCMQDTGDKERTGVADSCAGLPEFGGKSLFALKNQPPSCVVLHTGKANA
jgi:hypothetical protein